MQTCLFSARCFSRNFHRKPSLDLHRQAHRCRLSAEGQTYLLKSTIDKHFKHVVCRHRRPRTLFLQFKLILDENETYCKLNWGPAFDHMKTHRRFLTATFITFIPIPICVLAGVYSIIAWTIRKKNKKTKEKLSCRQIHRDQQLRKIVRLAMAIMISFVSCMAPLLIYSFLKFFLWNYWESPPICAFQTVIPFISVFLLHSWSAVNPCICFIFSENYRNGLRQCFHCNGLGRRKQVCKTTTKCKRWRAPAEAVLFRTIQVAYALSPTAEKIEHYQEPILYLCIYIYIYIYIYICIYVFKSLLRKYSG